MSVCKFLVRDRFYSSETLSTKHWGYLTKFYTPGNEEEQVTYGGQATR